MKRQIMQVLVLMIMACFALAACSAKNKTIRVGTDATWAPFEVFNESTQQFEGFDIDLMNAIAEKTTLKIEYVNVPFDALLAGMAQCQYDAAISSMTITQERAQDMLFTDPYFSAGQLIIIRNDNTDITGKDTLVGKNVGVQINTTGASEAAAIAGVNVKIYDAIDLAFADLVNQQLDAVIVDDALAQGYISSNSGKIKAAGEPITNEEYGIAVCKNNPDLLEKLNAGLDQLDNDGFLDQLVEKWFMNNGTSE
ncbi:MAG: basic amino acid ABC transporter substrate-binding protein [Chloroflexota bacterium]|nr:MAG: basic amino acid ABC transporter substrate-binding protein [Chloroflexota bacterium]